MTSSGVDRMSGAVVMPGRGRAGARPGQYWVLCLGSVGCRPGAVLGAEPVQCWALDWGSAGRWAGAVPGAVLGWCRSDHSTAEG